MLENILARLKKRRGRRSPQAVNSLTDLLLFLKRERIVSVMIEPACYAASWDKAHRITIDYTLDRGNKKKSVCRQEVLLTIEGRSTDEHLLQKMRELYPVIRRRADMLRNELGVIVTIPEQFVKAFAPPYVKSSGTINA